MRRYLGVWCLLAIASLAGSQAAFGQSNWAEELVDVKELDFGVIATGAEAEKSITIENTLQYPVYVSHVTTACKCAELRPKDTALEKNRLLPGEKLTLRIGINTYAFKQERKTSASIFFSEPQYAEVRIPIHAYIRTDVVFKPGKVEFGSLDFLKGAKTNIRIEYAGRPDWQIRSVKSSNSDIVAVPREIMRVGQNVTYDLEVTLGTKARPGRIRDLITLVTDDAANPYVPLMVEGVVVSQFVLANSNISISPMKPGQTTTVRLIVRGKEPFLIEDVDCKEMSDCFDVKFGDDPKTLQQVELEFTAPNKEGKFSEELVVKIKGHDEVLRCVISGRITGG